MSRQDLPKDVLEFIESCIDSIEQLQVLLLLHSDPTRSWGTIELTLELRSTETSIARRLSDLYERKVLVRMQEPDRHRFLPSSPELENLTRQLAELNQTRPYSIMEAVYSQPNRALRAFAEAFKLRGDS